MTRIYGFEMLDDEASFISFLYPQYRLYSLYVSQGTPPTPSRNVLTLRKSISLAIRNTLCLGLWVDIASLWVPDIRFWVTSCFLIYTGSVELIIFIVIVTIAKERMQRPDWDTYFLLQAEIAKLRSNCLTRHIGAVIVKDNRQIATGYNGTPPGVKNCYEGGCLRCLARTKGEVKSGEGLDRCLCTHAEANAIMQCALFGNAGSTKGAMLYSTFAPCLECSKMAISVGIKRIVVLADYPEDGTQLLRDANVELVKLNPDLLKPWLSVITADPESSAKAVSK
jgi:dCMP deaminase